MNNYQKKIEARQCTMNYSANMPDWHQYNSTQPIGSEVPSTGQNANHSPIFGPSISPRRLNGPTFSPEGLSKPQNEVNYNPRSFQQSPNTLNGPNVLPANLPIGSAAQMSACHSHYGAPSPRNTMIEGSNTSLDSRNAPSGSLNEAIGQRNHQISMNRSAEHLNCPTINGSLAPMGQRSTPTSLQGPISTSSRQGPASYMACKGPCCNPDTNISYQSWEKFGPYPASMPYRDTGYPPVDNRRFGNEFENREHLSTGSYNIDPRRNFPDYKYRKEPIIARPYAHPPGVIQSYPVQNYNFPGDYQKYPAYPMKEYPRENSIANPQNPSILKYQEQSVIVQQKYFTKQIQYQNGVIPKSIVPANMGSNVISRAQNPYFNPQLARDFPRGYSDSTPLANRAIQTANPMHATYPKYQMYQQKIAMQRFSMENHLRELTRIPGYQSHPKYQESVLRYRELLRLQQTVDYQSTVQDAPKVVTSQVNDEIPPINLQFDQNGVLINSSFAHTGFSNLQSPIGVQNSRNLESVNNSEVKPENSQQSEQFKNQASIDNPVQDQCSSSLSQTELPSENEQQHPIKKDQLHVQKYESGSLSRANSDDGQTLSMDHRNSRDFADKPELDVRQFLANWDESEDEDGANANLPDIVLSNSTSGVVEYENTKAVSEDSEELENCSESEDCRARDDCGMFKNTPNESIPSNSTDNQIYSCNLLPISESIKSVEHDLHISDSGKETVRTGTVIHSTSTEYTNETTLHIMENFVNGQVVHGNVKISSRETESSNNNERDRLPDTVKDEIIVKKEVALEEETLTSIKKHIEAYNHETNMEIHSSIEELNHNDGNSRSSYEKESSEDTKHHFSSHEDLSESDDNNSMDSNSISSFINSPKIIKGTEIHVDSQELSIPPVLPKSNSEIVDSTNLQKQNSFASEESHNPDDISLPDLPTSECTPISTTLNTPIHSDSEESSEPVIDLTTPANPIEIIQNSPMLSFTHSPIKMEPYEHLDENDLTDKTSPEAFDFEFQASSSCDNDYEKLTDVSSHTTEQYNISHNDEDTFDSDCVEISSGKVGPKIEGDVREKEMTNDVIDNIAHRKQFTFNKDNPMATDQASSTLVDTDHQPWPSVTGRAHEHQIYNNAKHQDTESEIDKSETLLKVKDRLSVMSEVTEDHLEDNIARTSNDKNYHGISRWPTNCEMQNIGCESPNNMTALNLVKDENKAKPYSRKLTDKTEDSSVTPKGSRCHTSNLNDGIDFKRLDRGECNSSMENHVLFTSTEHPVEYTSPSEKDKMYTESIENQSNFAGSLNIPLIPGEDFEEPKMPVLPMEGNCLTTIIKNTSPITDLDVLGSDEEKLDKMDEIWMEVGGVETVDKVADVNIATFPESGEGSDREKSLSSRNKVRMPQKNEWKYLKNSIKPKDPSKLFGNMCNNGKEKDWKNSVRTHLQLHKSSCSEIVQKEVEFINKDLQSAKISGTDNTAIILQDKHDFAQIPIISKVHRDSSFRQEDNSTHDMCLENNATEIIKCKEKTNHINDIATKLLENARLFEPELKKMDTQRMESSDGESSRDNSKKRIKLLKEFRKVKNKIAIDRPEIKSVKSLSTVKNDTVASIEIVNNPNAYTSTIDNVLQTSDSLIKNSRSILDCQVVQKININEKEIILDAENAVLTNISMPEEKLTQILNDGKANLTNDDTTTDNCSIVNMVESITVEDSIGVNSHETPNIKIVDPITEDINECAINLSKSSNDFSLLKTLRAKGCGTNHSPNFYISQHINIEEPTEIEGKANEETACTETRDHSHIASQSLFTDDNISSIEIVEEYGKTLEINHVELQNAVKDDRENNSTSTYTNLTQEYILKEDTKQKIDGEPTRNTDQKIPEDISSPPEKVGNSVEFSRNLDIMVDSIYENCKNSAEIFVANDYKMDACASGKSGIPNSNELLAVDDKEDQKPADKVVECEVWCDSDNLRNDIVDTSTINNEESMKLVNSEKGHNEKKLSSNHALEEEIVIQGAENATETIAVASNEKVDKLAIATQLIEPEKMIDNETLQDLDVISDTNKESKTIQEDLKINEKLSISNEPLIQTQSGESTKTTCLGSDKSAVDASLEAFGFENSSNYDFNNFDVAPNISNIVDIDHSNDWKYSKAYARFEDCERYKNPDNFINPILTSLESLDNLNTVPVYTTKDGKITYSPNPKFTYRALIMEAREREGYPATRESYYENPKNQESFHYSKNQASLRKRKNSEGYSYFGNYGKKNYSKYYKPREYGESSMKNFSEPWNRSHCGHNKYSHQSRDQNSYHFTPHNGDEEQKYTTENIVQEKVSSTYNHRESSTISNEHNKKKNGTSDNFKCNNRKQYKQLKEQSASDSVCILSRSNWDLKCDQSSTAVALVRSETTKTTYNKKNKTSRSTISTGKYLNNLKNYNRFKDFPRTENFTSESNEYKDSHHFTTNISPMKEEPSISSDIRFEEKQCPDVKVEELESISPKTEDQPSYNQNLLEIPNNEARSEGWIIRSGLFSTKWEDNSENLTVRQRNSLQIEIPNEPFLDEIKEVCDEEIKFNELYDGVDDIYESKTSDIYEKKSNAAGTLDNTFITSLNSVEATIVDEKFEDFDNSSEKLNIESDELNIDNVANKNESCSILDQPIQTDEDFHEQNTTEILNEDEPAASLNKGTERIPEKDKINKRTLHCTENQIINVPELKLTEKCSLQVNDVGRDDLVKEDYHMDKQNKFKSSNQNSEVEVDSVTLESNNEISHDSEKSDSLQEIVKIERNQTQSTPKLKSCKIKAENKNGTSVKNVHLATNNSISLKTTLEYENILKPQAQFENYITYSPSNEHAEDAKVIPKLVIKKTDSLNCKNICIGSPMAISHDLFAEKVSDKEELGPKVSMHPKIPKILIRNAKSRPSTPSIEEITEEKTFCVTTKEDSKAPKVKIRFEEKRPRSPSVLSNENISKTDATEIKIPKMKIKLEDRLPKLFIENVKTESSQSNETVQKTIPKMKIKKFKGASRQVVDTHILPVSIPRMFIYTEYESEKEISLQTLVEKEVGISNKNLKSVVPNSTQDKQKSMKDADFKKIPKLKIKRQGSGCSIELNRKRRIVSPIQSELKKVKKSLKLAELNDKKQPNKIPVVLEHQDSLKKLDSFNVKQSYELVSSEKVKYTTEDQTDETVRGVQTKSTGGHISETAEEIPKVIIKRASPSAEFKCELSQGRRDAMIKNKRWQPEVKLQRSWVLDCMAKDLNLDKLKLKLATPDSILKKCLTQKKTESGETCVRSEDVNNDRVEKKLFRSKSTSDLAPAHESTEILVRNEVEQNERNTTDNIPSELITRKRCKSDLGSTFSKYSENFECSKKLRYNNHSSRIQFTSKSVRNYMNDSANSANTQSVEKSDIVVEEYQMMRDLQIDCKEWPVLQSRDKTLDENMNSKNEIYTPNINQSKSLTLNNETSDKSHIVLDLNSKISSGSTSATDKCEYFENGNENINIFMKDLKTDETQKRSDGDSDYVTTNRRDKFEVSKDSLIVKNSPTLIASHDRIGQSETVNNTNVPVESVILQTPISIKPNTNIVKNNSEICCSDASNTSSNLETIIFKNNIHKLDINDNSDESVRETQNETAISENLLSNIDVAKQENTSMLNGNVLEKSVINKSKWTDLNARDLQRAKNDINLNNSLRNVIDSDSNSVTKAESVEENQRLIETLSSSPNLSESEVEIQTCPVVIEENGICLYHEDAIPTQFELELEIIDNTVPDPLEVPVPQDDYTIQEVRTYSRDQANEDNYQSNEISNISGNDVNLDDFKSGTTFPEENETNFSQDYSINTCQRAVFTHSDKRNIISHENIDKQKITKNADMKTTVQFVANNKKSFSHSGLLVKEVMAAKEMLRKCLAKSKHESKFKSKARPKTAAEKKQGSSFDLSTLSTCKDSPTKLEDHSSMNFTAEANSSRQIDNNKELCQNETKTELKVKKIKSERKHSKGSKNNLIKKKYSSLPTNIQKYTNLTQIEAYLIPKHSSTDIKDSAEFTKGEETSISHENSKYLLKNQSNSDTRNKIPELINSDHNKCRSKSSRHDVNSKYARNSKSAFPNTAARESSSDFGKSQEKSISDAAKHKYKLLKTSLDQNVNLVTDKTKFKFYKIPKIIKSTNPESERLTEELQESRSKEARMPILEPQVDLNRGLEVSELSSDRETSRSPPLITNQESRTGYEIATRTSESQISLNNEKDDLLKQTKFFEKEVPEAVPSYGKETTVADIVNDMAYHEKATIKHRRYCTLCERWFPTVARHRRHLSGYQHRHTELTQRRTIHALFTLFTGRPCPRLQPPGVARIDCEPGELTPLQIAVQGVTKESNKVDGNITKPTSEDK